MADDNREFRIPIVTTADLAGAKATEAELDRLKEKAATTTPGAGFPTGGPGGTGGATPGVAAANAVLSAEEKQAAIESQLQTIAATRLELVQAQAAGDEARVGILRQELAIRSAILGVMRTEALTQAELVALGETEAAALGAVNVVAKETAGAGLLAGTQFARARNEAVTFVRELATGAPTTRTLGALLGTLGPSLVGGAVAGLLLKGAIENVTAQQEKVNKELDEQGSKLVDAALKWKEVARAATTPEDVRRVAEATLPQLNEISAKLRSIVDEDLGPMETVIDAITRGVKNAFTLGGDPNAKGFFTKSKDEAVEGLTQIQKSAVDTAHGMIHLAEESEKAFERLKAEPVAAALSELTGKIANLKTQQDGVNLTTEAGIKRWVELGKEISVAEAQIKGVIDAQKESHRFLEDLEGEKSATEKINDELKFTEQLLRAIGVNARTPAEAFAAGQRTAGALGGEIRRLADEWAKLRNEQEKTLTGDLFKGPKSAEDESFARRRQFEADLAARRELAAEQGTKAPDAQAERARFNKEEELRLLQRQQALQRSLLPPGVSESGQDALRALGRQGLSEFEARAERIRQLRKELEPATPGTPTSPSPTPTPQPGQQAAADLQKIASVFEAVGKEINSGIRQLIDLWK